VDNHAGSLQFYIVDGGAEGFLDDTYAGRNASAFTQRFVNSSGSWAQTIIFDDDDLLIAFDKNGKLISVALLRRPIDIDLPKSEHYRWTEDEANKVLMAGTILQSDCIAIRNLT
jgi:hypothetical protein